MNAAAGALERAFRDERAAVLATITRRLDGDLALAEDVVQDAFVAAAVEWDRRGVPDRPGAWLTVTAWRKALDRLRHERVARERIPDLVAPVSYDLELELDRSSLDDDQLRMLFTCCHPALPPEARMGLTLRSVAGFTVPEIARAFLSTEAAMERRLTGRGARSPTRGSRSGCRRTICWPSGSRACCAWSTWCSTRVTRRRAAGRPCAGSCARRRSGSRGCWRG